MERCDAEGRRGAQQTSAVRRGGARGRAASARALPEAKGSALHSAPPPHVVASLTSHGHRPRFVVAGANLNVDPASVCGGAVPCALPGPGGPCCGACVTRRLGAWRAGVGPSPGGSRLAGPPVPVPVRACAWALWGVGGRVRRGRTPTYRGPWWGRGVPPRVGACGRGANRAERRREVPIVSHSDCVSLTTDVLSSRTLSPSRRVGCVFSSVLLYDSTAMREGSERAGGRGDGRAVEKGGGRGNDVSSVG